ncbi:MAG: hypothetical protein Q4B86_00545 [Eubacteriales bacterium]|nr:hypothetical protein [Eubacteriales bacterium]
MRKEDIQTGKENKRISEDMKLDELIKAALSEMEDPEEDVETCHEWSEGFEDKIKNLIANADNIINEHENVEINKDEYSDLIDTEIKSINENKPVEISFWRKNKKSLINAASLLIIFGIGVYGMKSAGLFGTAAKSAEAVPEVAAEIAEYGVNSEADIEPKATNEPEAVSANRAAEPRLKVATAETEQVIEPQVPQAFSAAPANIAEDNNVAAIFDEVEAVSGLDFEVDEESLNASEVTYEVPESGDIEIRYFSNRLGTKVVLDICSDKQDTAKEDSFEKAGKFISITFENENIEASLKNAEIEKWKSFIK